MHQGGCLFFLQESAPLGVIKNACLLIFILFKHGTSALELHMIQTKCLQQAVPLQLILHACVSPTRRLRKLVWKAAALLITQHEAGWALLCRIFPMELLVGTQPAAITI